MKLALLGSLAVVAGGVAASSQGEVVEQENHQLIEEDADPFSSRSLAESPVPIPIVVALSILNFFNALQESDSEVGRDGDSESGWSKGMWRAVKNVPNVLYETSSMVAPLTLRYVLSEESHPHCQQRLLCEMNNRIKERYGKPGEIAMQLASSAAGYALGGTDAQRYDSLVDAARHGRRGKDCSEMYPKCVGRSDSSAMPALLRMASKFIKNN